jgi:hypothetical protein
LNAVAGPSSILDIRRQPPSQIRSVYRAFWQSWPLLAARLAKQFPRQRCAWLIDFENGVSATVTDPNEAFIRVSGAGAAR